jgi:hypothetical protein
MQSIVYGNPTECQPKNGYRWGKCYGVVSVDGVRYAIVEWGQLKPELVLADTIQIKVTEWRDIE